MRRILLGMLFLVICGCGGGSSAEEPAQATSFAGVWGYDDATTTIRAEVVAPGPVEVMLPGPTGESYPSVMYFGYSGTVQVTKYDGRGITAEYKHIYTPATKYEGTDAGSLDAAYWGEDNPNLYIVLIPVDVNSRLDCKVQNGFMNMSTATYRLTRR
jgi:hypothetical protein